MLAIIDHLPRHSHYVAAVADDDEIPWDGKPAALQPPSLSEWSPEVELLTGLYELARMQLARMSTAPGKKVPVPKPLPRPVTAAERARRRRAAQKREFLARKLWPDRHP